MKPEHDHGRTRPARGVKPEHDHGPTPPAQGVKPEHDHAPTRPAQGVKPGYDYVAVGHVTLDVIEDRPGGPVERPGGGALYSALQAARLGRRALIITRGDPAQIERLLEPYMGELDVRVQPAAHTTTLVTRGHGPSRSQRVRAWAGPIVDPLQVSAAIVHFAPVARETPPAAVSEESFVGLTPQGLVRTWQPDGPISLVPLDPQLLPARVDAAVLSAGERFCCAPLLAPGGPGAGAVMAVTAGAEPTELRLADGAVSWIAPIAPERLCDELGAGDVFAAAFFVELQRGAPPAEAALYASAAAAVRVEGEGPGAIGDATAIAARLRARADLMAGRVRRP